MTLSRSYLRDTVAAAFGMTGATRPVRLGLEVEAIPIDTRTGLPATIEQSQHALRALGWTEQQSATCSAGELRRPDGARLTFEPGGQIEYSSAPHATGSTLLADVERAIADIRGALADAGATLLFAGLDPHSRVEDVPLQLDALRYRRMDAYFASRGPAGRRMMRQTASVQLCVDTGRDPLGRWRLLGALAPIVASVFANSPLDRGIQTGERSRRRRIWAELDPARTGLRALGADPIEEYLAFALAAPAFLMDDDPRAAAPFADWIARDATTDDWAQHLSTLFPDVRPRGYFEFRVADAVEGDALPAIIALVAGPAWHASTGDGLTRLLPQGNAALMARAGAHGLDDAELNATAVTASTQALTACELLGDLLLNATDLARARNFFHSYTFAGRMPADEYRATVAA